MNYQIQKYIDSLRERDMDVTDLDHIGKHILWIAQTERVPLKHITVAQIAAVLNAVMTIRIVTDSDNPNMRLLCVYHDGIYDTNLDVLQEMAMRLNSRLTENSFKKVIYHLEQICETVILTRNPNLVAVNNGIFDYEHKRLLPFDKDYVFLSKSCVNYNEDAKPKTFSDGWNIDDWLKDLAYNENTLASLWDVILNVIRPFAGYDKIIWLHKTKHVCGTSTFCELLYGLLGEKACAIMPVSEFDQNKRYGLSQLIGKQAIIGHENDFKVAIKHTNILKSIIHGRPIIIPRKYKDPIHYIFNGVMVQCVSELPIIGLFGDEQTIVPFDASFENNMNKNIRHEYVHDPEVLEYVLYKALNMDVRRFD